MRPIDADRLIDEFEDTVGNHIARTRLKLQVQNQPTIDAVEVVRCKDCVHWVKDGNDSFGYAMFCEADCSLGGQGIKKPDDFCSYGERKDNA